MSSWKNASRVAASVTAGMMIEGLPYAIYWARRHAAEAAARAANPPPPLSLSRQRQDLVAAVGMARDGAYIARRDAIEAARIGGVLPPITSRVAEHEAALAQFDLAHPEIRVEAEAARAAETQKRAQEAEWRLNND